MDNATNAPEIIIRQVIKLFLILTTAGENIIKDNLIHDWDQI